MLFAQCYYRNDFNNLTHKLFLLTTNFFHLVFTTLDISIISNEISYKISANTTGLQIFDPNNIKVESYYSELNEKRKIKRKPVFSFKPVIQNNKFFFKILITLNILEYWFVYL